MDPEERSMIELTQEQRRELEGPEPVRALDPETKQTYVLVRTEVYERLQTLLGDSEEGAFVHEMYPHVMEVFGREGWDDPAMDVYDELDPRRKS
jgi:hypothetical protein